MANNELLGRQEPSTGREIPELSPERQVELHQRTIESGQVKEQVHEVPSPYDRAVRQVTRFVDVSVRSLDEAFALGIDRKWEEVSSRTSVYLGAGEKMDFEVDGHSIVASKDDDGVTFSIDGEPSSSEIGREFLMRNSVELVEEMKREAELRAIEEERRQEEQARNQERYGEYRPDDDRYAFVREEEERKRRRDEMTRAERGNTKEMDREEGIER